jgi:exosome complex RNA-binding protein Rrp42 (RNase PH superfamily)
MGGDQMKWKAELMYIARNDQGVVVGMREIKPNTYESANENGLQEQSRSSSDVYNKSIMRQDASVSSLGLAFPKRRNAVGD